MRLSKNVPMEKPSERACWDFSRTTDGTPTCRCRDCFWDNNGKLLHCTPGYII